MSWERIRELPGRKLVGVFFGGMGGFFALGFLGRSLILWRDVPSGVFELIGLLTGGFLGYLWSSVKSDQARRGLTHREETTESGGERDGVQNAGNED